MTGSARDLGRHRPRRLASATVMTAAVAASVVLGVTSMALAAAPHAGLRSAGPVSTGTGPNGGRRGRHAIALGTGYLPASPALGAATLAGPEPGPALVHTEVARHDLRWHPAQGAAGARLPLASEVGLDRASRAHRVGGQPPCADESDQRLSGIPAAQPSRLGALPGAGTRGGGRCQRAARQASAGHAELVAARCRLAARSGQPGAAQLEVAQLWRC